MIVRNERTQPRIQNQVSILAVKGSSSKLKIITNIRAKITGSHYKYVSLFQCNNGQGPYYNAIKINIGLSYNN